MLRLPDLDRQHLNALSICHYVMGGLTALSSTLGLIYVVLGIVVITSPSTMSGGSGAPPPALMGWMFLLIGSGVVTIGWTYSVLIIMGGRFLARHKHRLFCMVMAGVSCAWVPLGTLLGVFTLVVLLRPSVKELFDAN